MAWKQLLKHPFWEEKLKHLIPAEEADDDFDETNDQNITHTNFSRISMDRPRTTAGSTVLDQKQPEINVSFSIRLINFFIFD